MLKTHYPLLIPLAFFIGGIITASQFQISYLMSAGLTLSLLFAVLGIKNQHIKSVFLYLAFYFLGMLLFTTNDHSLSSDHFSKQSCNLLYYTVKKKEETKKGYRYTGRVDQIRDKDLDHYSKGNLLVYTPKEIHLERHSTYLLDNSIKPIDSYQNPGHFDYGKYLSKQNIYHSLYLTSQPIHVSIGSRFLVNLENASSFGREFFIQHFIAKDKAAFVNALLLGDKKGMKKEDRELFINNGLAHLLAISGMHVGIILLILNSLFSFLPLRKIKGLLVISGIWIYILLSGLQIPAIRAGFMFSVYLLGQFSNRNIKGLNSVFFAALVLLSIQPLLIFQLSFQLSFTAMASILLFYKRIFQVFTIKHFALIKIWQLLALNLSVQILVLPLSIFYFKQVPTYSIFTSMLSMPFIIFIMWASVLALAMSFSDWVSHQICTCLEAVIDCYFIILQEISKLPFALIQHLELHSSQLICWIFGAIGLLFYTQRRTWNPSLACISFLPLILLSSFFNISSQFNRKITIYDDTQQIIIDYSFQKKVTRYKEEINKHSYQVEGQKSKIDSTLSLPTFLTIEHLTIAIVSNSEDFKANSHIDICILNTNTVDLSTINQRCAKVIIPRHIQEDSTYKNSYSIKNQGAFSYKF